MASASIKICCALVCGCLCERVSERRTFDVSKTILQYIPFHSTLLRSNSNITHLCHMVCNVALTHSHKLKTDIMYLIITFATTDFQQIEMCIEYLWIVFQICCIYVCLYFYAFTVICVLFCFLSRYWAIVVIAYNKNRLWASEPPNEWIDLISYFSRCAAVALRMKRNLCHTNKRST